MFSILTHEDETTNFGLYYGFNYQNSERYVFLPKFENYLDLVLRVYEENLIRDQHERVFVNNLIITFSRQYSRFSFEQGVHNLSPRQLALMQRLQNTFPGKLATLEAWLHTSAGTDTVQILALAQSAEALIDDEVARQEVSVFYQYYGLVHLALNQPSAAIVSFEKSLEVMPSAGNKAVCHLNSLYLKTNLQREHEQLVGKYSLEGCS